MQFGTHYPQSVPEGNVCAGLARDDSLYTAQRMHANPCLRLGLRLA